MEREDRKFRRYVADFETTVYDGQDYTEVWLYGICELYTEKYKIGNSLDDFMWNTLSERHNHIIYFHNLKFDGSFILDWLKRHKGFHERLQLERLDGKDHWFFEKSYKLQHRDYTYQISDRGVWYSITIMFRGYLFIFYDSLKIYPFSVAQIADALGIEEKKLSIEYKGERHAGGTWTYEEEEYMIHDLIIPKKAMEAMLDRGFDKSTIGSNCLQYFKRFYDDKDWNMLFPQLYDIEIDKNIYGVENAGEYIHKSYHGGWCYVKEDIKQKVVGSGFTVDANSLYPSQMHSKSGNSYPVGRPTFYTGKPDVINENEIHFITIRCRFRLKSGYLPFIQIKGDFRYNGREMLKSNEVHDKYGNILADDPVTLTLTSVDLKLFLEHYDAIDLQYLHGCMFRAVAGLFDDYVDHFMREKMEATNKVVRTHAKLFLNNLYGRFSMYHDSSFKAAYMDAGIIKFNAYEQHDKVPAYIAIGSMVTSYARNETIRKAQQNYDIFCYADTDSLHCIGDPDMLRGVPIHDKDLCKWKIEIEWERALFHRTKSYIEYDGAYHITCAGMGKKAKSNLVEMLEKGMAMEDFDTGLIVPGNLKAKRIIGGVILQDVDFEMRH